MSDDFAEFAASELPRLVRLARLLTGNAEDAWDLTQDCLVRVGLRWNRIDRDGNPGAYARVTLVNLSKNLRRSRSRERKRMRALVSGTPNSTIPAPLPEWLDHVLATLTPQQRAAIALRYLEDLDDTAIAGILNCSEVTVRSHISRGLARLRDAAPGGRD